MIMAERAAAGGQLGLRGMFSLEPWTAGDSGYPLLFQSGESLRGEPLHDRQHPHDVWMELAGYYRHAIGDDVGFELYAAPVGEPALGPAAFMHRMSASSDPLAPLGHHWQDSTHISFGVATVGLFGRIWKVEASWFNGREPDENRTDFDFRPFDSWSARLSVNPHPNWSFQVSGGVLDSPEELEPDVSLRRTTASVTYNLPLSNDGNWATTFVWGRNGPDEGPPTNSLLLESDWAIDSANAVFGRLEYVVKTGHDLVVEPEDGRFPIVALALGYVRNFKTGDALVTSVGIRGSVDFFDSALEDDYGSDVGYGVMVFVRLWPAKTKPDAGHEGAHP